MAYQAGNAVMWFTLEHLSVEKSREILWIKPLALIRTPNMLGSLRTDLHFIREVINIPDFIQEYLTRHRESS